LPSTVGYYLDYELLRGELMPTTLETKARVFGKVTFVGACRPIGQVHSFSQGSRLPRRRVLLGVVAVLIGSCPAFVTAQVIAPDQAVAGQSQHELADRWWPWAINVPIASNPVVQSGDIGAVAGDQGSVFFLAGSTSPDPVTRNVIVPPNKPLFFPLIAINVDNVALPGDPPTTLTAAELLDLVKVAFDNATDLFLEVDGVSMADLPSHRQTTLASQPYSYTTTSTDNLIDAVFGGDSTLGTGTYPSTVSPAVQDGYWVALEGFAEGTTHTLHFGGRNGFDFTQDITYNLTVVPEPGTGALVSGASMFLLLSARRRLPLHSAFAR
jgi:hypothetical protein